MAELVTREIELYKKLKRSLINEVVMNCKPDESIFMKMFPSGLGSSSNILIEVLLYATSV